MKRKRKKVRGGMKVGKERRNEAVCSLFYLKQDVPDAGKLVSSQRASRSSMLSFSQSLSLSLSFSLPL
jgi:hypothetical protein